LCGLCNFYYILFQVLTSLCVAFLKFFETSKVCNWNYTGKTFRVRYNCVHPHQLPSASSNHLGVTYTGDIHHWPGVDDKIHMVPLGFIWPSYTAATMWNLWFLGDSNKRTWICPFRSISPKVDLRTQKCRTNRSRTSKVVSHMVEIAIAGSIISNIRDITTSNLGAVFEYSYAKLLGELYASSRMTRTSIPARPQDININTLANRMICPDNLSSS